MDESRLLARARDYMHELAEGRDPLTGRPLSDATELDQPKLRRCFAFVEAYLQRELTRAADASKTHLPNEREERDICSEEDVPATEFYARLAAVATAAGKLPVSERCINNYLLRAGLVDGRVESVFVERKTLRSNARSEELGIYDVPRISPRTGALCHTLMLTPDAQHWLIRALPHIVDEAQAQVKEEP
jgi:hypothetical protein